MHFKRVSNILILIFIILFFCVCGQVSIYDHDKIYRCQISGIVLDSSDNLIPNATVTLQGLDFTFNSPQSPQLTSSGLNGLPGAFVFEALPPGTYEITVKYDGKESSKTVTVNDGSYTLVIGIPGVNVEGSTTAPATITGTSTDQIFGYILDANKNSIGSAKVTLKNLDGTTVPIAGNPQNTRDSRDINYGSYRFSGVGPGTYKVETECYDSDGHKHIGYSIVTLAGSIPITNIVIQFYIFTIPVETPTSAGDDIVPALAAVFIGTSVGIGAALLNRPSFFQMIWNKIQALIKTLSDKTTLIGKVFGSIEGLIRNILQRYISRYEIKIRHLAASDKKPLLAGISIKDILVGAVSCVALALAFLIAKKAALSPDNIAIYLLLAGVVTIVHELAHVAVAYRFKATTEYKIWGLGTVMLFLTSWLLGTAFAAPARMMINKQGDMEKQKLGMTMLAGPLVSFALSIAFLSMVPFGGSLETIGLLGLSMCMLSVVYSMMPFDPMEGIAVYRWNKLAWAVVFIPSFVYYFALLLFVS